MSAPRAHLEVLPRGVQIALALGVLALLLFPAVGSDFYVQGEPSAQWDENTFRNLRAITMGDMQFVDMGAVTRDPRFSADSMAARW